MLHFAWWLFSLSATCKNVCASTSYGHIQTMECWCSCVGAFGRGRCAGPSRRADPRCCCSGGTIQPEQRADVERWCRWGRLGFAFHCQMSHQGKRYDAFLYTFPSSRFLFTSRSTCSLRTSAAKRAQANSAFTRIFPDDVSIMRTYKHFNNINFTTISLYTNDWYYWANKMCAHNYTRKVGIDGSCWS